MVRAGDEHTRTKMETKRTKHESGGGVSLPEDIIFDVLARLPAKTLCRLRCVCKGWSALISDPAFVAAQRSCGGAADPHLIGVFSGAGHLPELRMMDMDGNVVRAFENTRSTPEQLPTRLDLICTDGGRSPLHCCMIIDPAAGRAFAAFDWADPWNMARTYSTSFGRATPSGVFKVLRLRLQKPFRFRRRDEHDGGDHHQLCEIATIMDGSSGAAGEPLTWRKKSAPPFVTGWSRQHKAIVNGVVYFMPHELEVDEDDDVAPSWYRIAAFDLEREEWKAEAINGPALGSDKEEMWSITLVELKGTLALVHDVERVNDYKYTSIWLLIDPNKSVWVKEYMIQMPKNQMMTTNPLGVLVDGRVLLWSSVFDDQETMQEVVLFYDPSTKALTDFMLMEEGFRYTLVFYTGSLLS